jgi:hypothetical protein
VCDQGLLQRIYYGLATGQGPGNPDHAPCTLDLGPWIRAIWQRIGVINSSSLARNHPN